MAAGKPSALDQRRAEFARYKEDVKKRGHGNRLGPARFCNA